MSQRADGTWPGGPRPDPPWAGRAYRRGPDPSIRVGDAERNQVADALSQHFSAGRLDDTELKDRLDRAMSAKTGADLSGLLSDLPPLVPSSPPPPPARRRGGVTWVVLGAVFLFLFTLPWHSGPWFWVPRMPWLLFGIIAFALWRRSRRRRWHPGVPS